MAYIREVAGRKYHITNPAIENGIICRQKRLKAVQLSLVDTPPPRNGLSQVLPETLPKFPHSQTQKITQAGRGE